ncbi:hypothetical protein SAMN02799627_04723 [Methylobacterium sp. 13MFTsu3.1M2]|nr:hypothetical protein SAMN02799627_04723 [Methylobacterium sp. 13MFTsu3.1M2]
MPPTKTYTHKPRDLGPFPDFREITGIQCAFVDNGKPKTQSGRRSNAVQYKMIVEIYTKPPERLLKSDPQFKRNVELRGPNEFLKLIEDQCRKGLIPQAYHDWLADAVLRTPLEIRERQMYGQIRENKDGWRYFPFEFVVFDQSGESPSLYLFAHQNGDHQVLQVDQFNDYFANPPIKLTAYLDVDGQLKKHKDSS